MGLTEAELSTVGVTDPLKIEQIRRARFRLRRERIMADPNLSPDMKRWYLDPEIWDTDRAADEFGWGKTNVWDLRRATLELGPNHANAYPDLDNESGLTESGVEAGRLREWAEKRGSHIVDEATGKLIKRPPMRHGRTRADRGSLNKAGHTLGTPRRNKKGTPPGPRPRYTEEHIAQIKALASEFLSDAQIAERLGAPFDSGVVERLRRKNNILAGSTQRKNQKAEQRENGQK